MLDLTETTHRLDRVRAVMEANDIDAVLAIDWSRDEIMSGHQRWLTGYIPIGGPAAALVFRDGHVELISERIGAPVSAHYASRGFPIDLVNGFSAALIADRLARHRLKRVGYAGADGFSYEVAKAIAAQLPTTELADVSASLQQLRLRKSAHELALIRRSSAIADAVWNLVPEIFRIGRKNYEIIADIDHLVRLEGAEGGFHLVLKLPFLGRPMSSLANPERIEADARYLIEISPRYEGYYSQLTIPVTTCVDDEVARRALEDVVAAKEAAQPSMRPGEDLSKVAVDVSRFLAERGHEMASLSLGHFCGMALEEPRHDPSLPFRLEEGMTLIFHPVLKSATCHSLMRADTYVITPSGAERLNRNAGGLLTLR